MTTTTQRPAPTVPLDLLDRVRQRGLRASAARRLVLEALALADEPVSAERIADGIDGRVPRSDLASVYRNLEVLERHGLVRHVHFGHGPARWSLFDGRAIEHAWCERCGGHLSFDPAELEGVRAAIRWATGFDASFAHFPIAGVCATCAQAA